MSETQKLQWTNDLMLKLIKMIKQLDLVSLESFSKNSNYKHLIIHLLIPKYRPRNLINICKMFPPKKQIENLLRN